MALKRPKKKKSQNAATTTTITSKSDSEHTGSGSPSMPTTAKAPKKKNKDAVDDSGFLANINIASISNGNDKPRHENRGQDVDKFFSAKYSENGIDRKPRTYHDCKLCSTCQPVAVTLKRIMSFHLTNGQIMMKTGKEFDVKGHHIWCLAHIINLAMQAFIKTHMKSKFYNPASPKEHLPSTMGHD
ncbi:hypothetical protein BD769DRAFT_1387949 [Suillus cothurnatus]|nr:hypothetical protein BD769DRAFT_1387949 [Suillus cothurnatus]